MLRSGLDRQRQIDPDDMRDLIAGIAFLALLGLGLYLNVVLR